MTVSVSARKFTSCLAWWGGGGGPEGFQESRLQEKKNGLIPVYGMCLNNNCVVGMLLCYFAVKTLECGGCCGCDFLFGLGLFYIKYASIAFHLMKPNLNPNSF